MYAALLIEAIKEIEKDNQATRLEANGARGGGRMPSEDDREEYMGWIIDDFPGTAEQVQKCNSEFVGVLSIFAVGGTVVNMGHAGGAKCSIGEFQHPSYFFLRVVKGLQKWVL